MHKLQPFLYQFLVIQISQLIIVIKIRGLGAKTQREISNFTNCSSSKGEFWVGRPISYQYRTWFLKTDLSP